MANVLGELFADIATAIRSKTGDEGTMKPMDFPAMISNISRDTTTMDLKIATGDFTPTNVSCEIQHNLGVIPDIFIIAESSHSVEQEVGSMLKFAIGFGDTMLELLKAKKPYPGTNIYAAIFKFADSDGLYSTTASIGDNNSITTCNAAQQERGTLRSATSTTIFIGGENSMIKLNTKTRYSYMAIGGLF